ncbi:apolipoprotein N-acyltransferase [Cyanobium sp. NIES-981]|uniref:apolipoprotein N-acyltransferase n=1 Tax=Cyanobium sp. NIES-981 TaxID=1851505 RepID=UPI0007DE2327|nr:apolipoprotein N-acyltransferase [Cyanobium sp. NIES-981]SBO44450.1 Apolipoprotein N-acyltransferase [Cyanobium sp. NIES-981]
MAVEGRLAWIVVGVSGLLAGLALPPLGCPPLAWLALALLWSASGLGPSRQLLLGSGLWGGLAVLLSHRWLLGLHPLDWIGVPLPLSLPLCGLLLLLCAALGAVLLACWAWLAAVLGPQRPGTALLLSGVWGLAEVLLARGPLFWLGLGAAPLPHDRPLAGLAVLGGSGLVAAVQVLLGWGLWRVVAAPAGRLRRLATWLLLVLLLHGAGAALLAGQPPGSAASERVLVLQPAIPTREKQTGAARQRLALLLEQAMAEAQRRRAAVVVLPEGALGLEPRLAQPAAVELLSGGFRWQDGAGGPEQRSALLRFEPGARQASGAVDKHRLVPLGEWVPLASWWRWSGLSAVGGVEPGAPSRLLIRPAGPVAVAICYEISDGGALAAASRNGATWLLASANLDPYPLMLQRQFAALAQLRAIETGRWLVSSANTGPSLLVTPQGIVQAALAPGRAAVALFEPELRAGLTPYGRCGEALLLVLVGAGALTRWRTGSPGCRAESAGEAEGHLHQGEAQKPDQGKE